MEQFEFVDDVTVVHNGFSHKAQYHVDGGVLYLKLGDVVWRSPVDTDNVSGTARALLTEELLRREWRQTFSAPQPNSGPGRTAWS